MRLIITCGCGDTTQFAKDAFKIAFPKEDLPVVIEKNKENELLLLLLTQVLRVILINQEDEHVDLSIEDKFAYYINTETVMRYDDETGWYNDMDITIFDLRKGYYI